RDLRNIVSQPGARSRPQGMRRSTGDDWQVTAVSQGSEPMNHDSRNIVESSPASDAGHRAARAALEPVLRPLAETALTIVDGRLARVWLLGPGDLCETCPLAGECANRTRCLHLVASAGLT